MGIKVFITSVIKDIAQEKNTPQIAYLNNSTLNENEIPTTITPIIPTTTTINTKEIITKQNVTLYFGEIKKEINIYPYLKNNSNNFETQSITIITTYGSQYQRLNKMDSKYARLNYFYYRTVVNRKHLILGTDLMISRISKLEHFTLLEIQNLSSNLNYYVVFIFGEEELSRDELNEQLIEKEQLPNDTIIIRFNSFYIGLTIMEQFNFTMDGIRWDVKVVSNN